VDTHVPTGETSRLVHETVLMSVSPAGVE